MVLKPEAIRERLKLLEEVTAELERQPRATPEQLARDVPRRWVLERGLIAGANLIFDVTDHILAGQFHAHPDSYEAALAELHHRGVISGDLHASLEGLGKLRNLLVHLYFRIDPARIAEHHLKAPASFRRFAAEVLSWLEKASALRR